MSDTAPDKEACLAQLRMHQTELAAVTIGDLFSSYNDRFDHFSVQAAGLLLDYSKNRVRQTTIDALIGLARAQHLEARRNAMFSGEKINSTEQRAVLHTALRAPRAPLLQVDGLDVGAAVHAVLERMHVFSDRIRSGQWTGFSGQAITDVVNIGIGGSYLGPKLVCEALRYAAHPRLKAHFVSNVDGHDLAAVLAQVEPATTLFIIASKTFSTTDTMCNAHSARDWFLRHGSEADLARHFVAVSTNQQAVAAFGIDPENMFPIWDWVGGRYSIWSAIGLVVAVLIGFDGFRQFLAGGHAMDSHFRHAPLEKNMPVLLALIGVWNRNFLGCSSLSIAPYHQDLAALSGYLQQLDMESNGKRVTLDGVPVTDATCPVIWGDTGTNGQHAYFQLLHQGTDVIPVDFIAVLKPSHALHDHHALLLANCFAQSEALMNGKSPDNVRQEADGTGQSDDALVALIPHKHCPGNRPSNTILMDELTPANLGALIALYEHKVFVQGVMWGINSFDQWGVELGKGLAKTIHRELVDGVSNVAHDSSTTALIRLARAAQR